MTKGRIHEKGGRAQIQIASICPLIPIEHEPRLLSSLHAGSSAATDQLYVMKPLNHMCVMLKEDDSTYMS